MYHRRIGLEKKLSTKFLKIEEVVQLLKEGCGMLPYDEADHTTARRNGTQLLKIKLVLKEDNMEQDVLSLFWNILRAIKYSTIISQ